DRRRGRRRAHRPCRGLRRLVRGAPLRGALRDAAGTGGAPQPHGRRASRRLSRVPAGGGPGLRPRAGPPPLRDRILAETGLHASFGIATSKTVAKIASDLRKPRGFVVVRPGEEAEFLRPLPLRTLPGLGPATASTLAGLGLRTLGELAGHPAALLERRLGKVAAHSLTRRAQGIDTSPVTPPTSTKSISREET